MDVANSIQTFPVAAEMSALGHGSTVSADDAVTTWLQGGDDSMHTAREALRVSCFHSEWKVWTFEVLLSRA